jgi:clan AA aspartic protease (TIGR02281 family)
VLIDVGMGRQVVNMMLDTGASTSAITDDVANALVRDGHARWLGTRKFKMADGSTTEALTLVINDVRIGSHVVRDVEASVVPNGTMMLLGFPVVNQIGPFMINTRTRELIFEEKA